MLTVYIRNNKTTIRIPILVIREETGFFHFGAVSGKNRVAGQSGRLFPILIIFDFPS